MVRPDLVELSGPTTRVAFRDLSGSGWAVGALLRPAAIRPLGITSSEIVDGSIEYRAEGLHEAVNRAMAGPDQMRGRTDAVAAFIAWLADRVPFDLAPDAQLANQVMDLLASDVGIVRPEIAARALAISVRTLQRITAAHIGVGPRDMIRRRRLQEAAERVRNDPEISVASVAAELGYADQAHLARDFKTVVGQPPSSYCAARRRLSGARES